jgi:CheY-like chemotaxis protein
MCVHFSRPHLQGYEYREAVDGHEGVRLFENDGQFEYVSPLVSITWPPIHSTSVILLDLSMPVLDGKLANTFYLRDSLRPCP